MSDHENDHGDVRFLYPRAGVVVARNDPMGLCRVRVRIPGLLESTADAGPWAFPFGLPGGGGGTRGRGFKWVPPLGAEVLVLWLGGDPNRPYYAPAQWGAPGGESEVPEDARALPPDEAPDVHCLETERFKITIDDRKGRESLKISDKRSGDSFEIDGVAPGIQITATAALRIVVDGAFIVEAATVTLNGRQLAEGDNPS